MALLDSRTAARMTALAGATLLIAASAALSTLYAWQVGSPAGMEVAVALCVAALGGELLKPFAVAAAADCIRGRRWFHAIAALLLAGAAVAFSFTSELGLAATARGDRVAERAADSEAANAVRERRARAVAEIQALPLARSAAELQPQIDALTATPFANRCKAPSGSAGRQLCSEVATLRAEAARAQRRADLEAAIATSDGLLASGNGREVASQVAADPLAVALAAYANATGRQVAAEAISPWLALPLVVLLEIGSAFGVMVSRTIGAELPIPPGRVAAGVAEPAIDDADAVTVNSEAPTLEHIAPDPHRPATVPQDAVAAAVLGLIASRGGTVTAPQRTLATAVGFPLSRVNSALHRMAAAGQIRLDIGKQGTAISIAN